MKSFTTTINQRRRDLGLTQEEVHARLVARTWTTGVEAPSFSTVGNWFSGQRRPRHMEHLTALCEVLGLSVDEATRGEDAPLTAVESALLQQARKLNDAQQQALLAIASSMTKA